MKLKKNSDWVARLVSSRMLAGAEAWALEEPVRLALQRLIDGQSTPGKDEGRPGGNQQDVGGVGYALNVTWFRCRKLADVAGQRQLEAAGQALSACEARGTALGFYMLLPDEKETVCAGVNLYSVVLRESSLMQWADAEGDFLKHFAEPASAA